jgi:MoxR-like ATPase
MTATRTAPEALAYTNVVKFDGDAPAGGGNVLDDPDRRSGSVYVLDPELRLAIEVALATGRPLLLRGRPGTGKSSLAAWVARNLNRCFYDFVVTARTRAEDLMYSFDSVRRLADAQARMKGDPELSDFDYVEPRALWWAFNPETARLRGAPAGTSPKTAPAEPNEALNRTRKAGHAVLLVDEIDKADPDVPNNLLVALGSFSFHVAETGITVERKPTPADELISRLLVIFTTNEERDLPDAFVRRCVVQWLRPPNAERLVEIARKQMGDELNVGANAALAKALAGKVETMAQKAIDEGRRPPSTAEFLDALRACLRLKVTVESAAWQLVEKAVLRKPDAREAEAGDGSDA